MRNKSVLKGIAAVILLLYFLQAAVPLVQAAQETQEGIPVRVGFFSFDGYHMIDSRGKRSGYGYDYLQYLARYGNFIYEYEGYDKSWEEMQDMLENGEIDLLTSAQKTKERMERFDFSDEPIGTSAAILTVKAGNNLYMSDDYAQLNGIRIGLLRGNSRNQDLAQFARENGFTYRPVYFEDGSELAAALQRGDAIDAALTSNLRKIKNEWIVATFDVTPFYIIVKKGNRQLLDQINRSIARLQVDHKDLASSLFERYYTAANGDEIAYTAEERRYIKECRENGRRLRVTINSGRNPVSYFEDGEAKGIIPELAKVVLRRTGLPYEFVATPPTVDARELLARGEAEVRFDGISDFNDSEEYGLRATDAYLELPLSCVTLKSFNGKPESVAVIRNSDVVEEYVERMYSDTSIIRYDSADECLNAVLTGRQDAAFYQTYIAQRLVNRDIRNRIKEQLVPGYGMSFAVSVNQSAPLLFSILNKAVISLKTEEIDQIVLEETSNLSRSMSLVGYLYDHPVFWLLLLAFTACFIIILILYLFRRKNLSLEREKAREFERFISYVCKANNKVIEVEPVGKTCLLYQVKGGKVLCQKKKIDTEAFQIYGVHPEDKESVARLTREEDIGRLIRSGGEVYFECRIRAEKLNESYIWYAFTLQGVPQDDKNPGSLMVFIKDIDRAKREEEEKRKALLDALTAARQANEARGSFLSRMSHEIRTPLNAIIGYMTIAWSHIQNPEKTGEYLKKSEFAAHQLLNIVNDVLDISAIESGKMKIAHEEFNIRQLLSGITSIFRTQAAQKGVNFRVRLNDLTEEKLMGDQFRLNQILMNLLSNAVKFTPNGGQVTLTIQQKAVVRESVYLQIEVEDTGIGMSEEYKKRLFIPFEQQDASTARKFGGTGLGLSITKNLVSMMNGTVHVKSEEGRGTLFTVNLPLDLIQVQQKTTESYDFSNLQVLVLYDNNSDYRRMETLLERFGIAYDTALDQEGALQKIIEKKEKGEHYDICLIDWDAPEASGIEEAKRIREAAAPDNPILLAVAYEIPALPEGERLIEDIILKPVFQSSLFDVLSGICRRHGAERIQEAELTDFGLKGVRILLAEDNELNMEIAGEILTGYGLVIDGAKNGLEAAERFEQSEEGTYQAILMDIQMPVMDGYAAARRIRSSRHPQAASIPIIALTADAFTEDINRALAAGMNGHVSKPIDFEQLCRSLSGFLQK